MIRHLFCLMTNNIAKRLLSTIELRSTILSINLVNVLFVASVIYLLTNNCGNRKYKIPIPIYKLNEIKIFLGYVHLQFAKWPKRGESMIYIWI